MSAKSLLKESLEKNIYTLKFTGLPIEKKEGLFHKYYVLFIISFLSVNSDLAGAICWFLNGAQKGESLTSLTYVAPCITISFLANIRSISHIVYSEQVYNLISILKELEVKEMMRPLSEDKNNMIRRERNFLHLVLKVLNICNWFLIIAFPLMPLSFMLLDYIKTKKLNPILPLLILYPFDAFDMRVWPILCVKQIYAIMIVILEIGGTDFLFFICSTYIRIHFQLLGCEIEDLIKDTAEPHTVARDAQLQQRFKEIVTWHQQLIHAVELLEVIYRKSTLYNFVSSSALICLSGFNVTTIDDVAFVVSFLSFLFMSLLQIYFLCYFGDLLTRASVKVSDAVYFCKWYLADKRTAKMLHITQMRAQKPCKLTAYGFAEVNLMAFTKILSTAWSYFALLKTVSNSPRD